ncbi:hypothetical protein [Micromonospora sp. NBC_01813]|nr:hypothetical protein [Micromonospora sp. NBC_01813]WSA11502.1 hypothetical protein OG958_12385 [Micromonospora sp. NBC_01813]
MSSADLPQSVRDHFRNLGREHGRRLAERERQATTPTPNRG